MLPSNQNRLTLNNENFYRAWMAYREYFQIDGSRRDLCHFLFCLFLLFILKAQKKADFFFSWVVSVQAFGLPESVVGLNFKGPKYAMSRRKSRRLKNGNDSCFTFCQVISKYTIVVFSMNLDVVFPLFYLNSIIKDSVPVSFKFCERKCLVAHFMVFFPSLIRSTSEFNPLFRKNVKI